LQNRCPGTIKKVLLFVNTENAGSLSFDLRQKTGILWTSNTVYQEKGLKISTDGRDG
jgi:hypothetical protein